MVVLRVILGILAIIVGMDCVLNPAIGTGALCMMIAVLMLLFGIFAIVHYIEDKNREKVAKKAGIQYFGAGIWSLVFGIVAVILAIKAMSSETGAEVLFKIVSIMFGLYITLQGVTTVIMSNGMKKVAAPGWFALMLLGVLVALLGLFCIFNSFTSVVAMGTLIGLDIMIFGISLIMGRDLQIR